MLVVVVMIKGMRGWVWVHSSCVSLKRRRRECRASGVGTSLKSSNSSGPMLLASVY